MTSNVIGIGPAWLDRRQIGFKNPLGTKNYIYEQIYSSILPCDCWDHNASNTGHGGVFSLEFSPEGSLLVAACEKRSILVFDPLTHKKIHSMKNAHLDCVNCVKFLNSYSFATCSDDFTVALWDVRNLNQKVRTLKGHSNWVKNIEYSPQDDLLVTSGFDGTILTWEMSKYKDDGIIYNKVFSTNGLMRTRLTPDATKMIICTTGGYLIIIHNLDLSKMSQDLEGFKPNMYRLMQLSQTVLPIASDFTHLFCGRGKRNRIEFITDFPEGDDAEVVSSLQIHPDGHSAISRNVSHNEKSEWSCIHNIEERIMDELDGIVDENKDYDDNDDVGDVDDVDHKCNTDFKSDKILPWPEASHSISTTPSYIIQHSMFQNERSSLISRADAGTNTEQNDLSVSPSDVWEALVAIQEARISREAERVTSEESLGHIFRHQATSLNTQSRSTNSENQYFVTRILPNTSTYNDEEAFHNLTNTQSNSQNVSVMSRPSNQRFWSSLSKNFWTGKRGNKNLPLLSRYCNSLYRRSRVGQYDRTSVFRKSIYNRKIMALKSKKNKNFKLNTKYEINETKRLLNESEIQNEIITTKSLQRSPNFEAKRRQNFASSSGRNASSYFACPTKDTDASTSKVISYSMDTTTNTLLPEISLKKDLDSLKEKFINLENVNSKESCLGINSSNQFHKNEEQFQNFTFSGNEEEELNGEEGIFEENGRILNNQSSLNSHSEQNVSSHTSGERTILMGVFKAGTKGGIRGTTMRRHNVAVVKVSSATQTGTNSMVDSLNLKRTTSSYYNKLNRNIFYSTKSSCKITESSSNKNIKQIYSNCKGKKSCSNSSRYFSCVPVNKKIHQNANRLTHYIEEPNLGRGFIKEVCISPDGRIVCSPFGNGIRLLSFSPKVQDIFYCYPHPSPIPLHELTLNIAHKDIVQDKAEKMSDRRKGKGKGIYNSDPHHTQQQPQPQTQQSLSQQQTIVPQGTVQQIQTVTTRQPRLIYGKQMPVSMQTQQIPDRFVQIIYAQQAPMQLQGDPNVGTTYVLSNQHIPLSTSQVQDNTMIRRTEQVVCEVGLGQYQQMQAAQTVQQQPQPTNEDHMRAAVMTSQLQQTTEIPPQHVNQSQQTQTITLVTPRKKEKVLLPCMHCKDSFRTECQLQAHIRNKHIKPYKCDNCWKAFSFESQLKLHVTTHTGEKPYKCDVCPKAYARKTALFNHVRVHARKKFFKCCKYCGKGFKNEEKLEKHERMHSMGDERKYVSLEMFVDNK